MATYQKSSSVSGSWADKRAIHEKGVKNAKIVSETRPEPSMFKNEKTGEPQTQDVCKVRFAGIEGDFNLSLNRATLNGLIEAFGEDSQDWMNKVLTVNVLEGSKGFSVYLIPEGFERVRDDNNYVVITKIGGQSNVSQTLKKDEEIPTINIDDEEDIRIENVPF